MFRLKFLFIFLLYFGCCEITMAKNNENIQRARATLSSLYVHYSLPGRTLFKEYYISDKEGGKMNSISEKITKEKNTCSFLWSYSAILSGISSLYEVTSSQADSSSLVQILLGLNRYLDTSRTPYAYASQITSSSSDRYYDDNIWIGIDFVNLYLFTKDSKFLEKAELIWKFIESGIDKRLGGGVYWCEEKKVTKNTCSNAPAAVLALKLYKATSDQSFLKEGRALYEWTKSHLLDKSDGLYFDNINLRGQIDKHKYTYNSGQMLQASCLLYEITKEKSYLDDAHQLATACFNNFFGVPLDTCSFKRLKDHNLWFIAVMLRGYRELYSVDKSPVYLKTFKDNLDRAWNLMRDKYGLFNTNWSSLKNDDRKWLLNQGAMVEMYAVISKISQL